jgi:tol-pal system protein YbgF
MPGVLCLFALLPLLLSGCIPNINAVRADINDLKHEAFQAKKERAALKSALESAQGTGQGAPVKESLTALRDSQTTLYSQVSETLREMQTLSGRFEENKYFVDKELKRLASDIEVLKSKLDNITASQDLASSGELKRRIEAMEADISLIKAKLAALGAMPEKDAKKGKPSPNDIYDDAYRTFEARQYEDAIKKMQMLVAQYPDHVLSGNAKFWIGESYFNLKKYENSILAYEEVITKHKGHRKVPAAMLKQAYAFIEIGDKKAARSVLNDLVDKYPKSEMASKAKEKLAAIR